MIYADNTLLMSQSQEGIIKQLEIVKIRDDNGLKINYDKTKLMITNNETQYDHLKFFISSIPHVIEVVED